MVSEKTKKKKIVSGKILFASLTQNPNASQWNIGCVGSLALGLCVGHVHFILFVLISFASDTRRKPVFQWNMGFSFCTNNKERWSGGVERGSALVVAHRTKKGDQEVLRGVGSELSGHT